MHTRIYIYANTFTYIPKGRNINTLYGQHKITLVHTKSARAKRKLIRHINTNSVIELP